VLRNILGLGAELDCEVWRLNGRKGQPGAAWQQADVTGEYDGTPGGFGDHRFSVRDTKKRAPSPEAEQWAGWGTALKPAFEPIILARKPLRGTVAANVLAHGTGAINVDACRVAGAKPVMERTATIVAANCMSGVSTGARSTGAIDTTTGRWPANVLHDGSDEVEAAFAAFGNSESSSHTRHNQVSLGSSSGGIYGTASGFNGNGIADTGSASRFFYCAKADRGDRADSRHPTVKPVSLLRWLVRLVCPPGGTVLDPFAGSGTTGEAAMLEGFDAVLIERDAQHAADIRHRIKRWSGLDAPLFAEVAD
jgi:site-specific DNA-methyltransferase (adenine-specific)